MPQFTSCTLCGAPVEYFYLFRKRHYYRCSKCRSVMMHPAMHLSPEEEKKRYEEHNNDVNDPRYQQFVRPLVDKIQEDHDTEMIGLDYGSGTGPVAAKLLGDKGYYIELYDPYFWDNQDALTKKYNFIICCEVVEHFSSAFHEFKLLSSLLQSGGSIYCMTEIYDESINFGNWYYINDPTHVFLYSRSALEWMKEYFNFTDLLVEGRLIRLKL